MDEPKLPKSLAAVRKKNFREVLINELYDIKYHLPLGQFCQEGGWFDTDTVHLEVSRIYERDGFVVAVIAAEFQESVPTSCAEITFPRDRFGRFEVVLDPEGGTADFDSSEE